MFLLCAQGTPIIFDYRLGHRGLGNRLENTPRPVLYFTYSSLPGFSDDLNFNTAGNQKYLPMPELLPIPR